VKKAQFVNRARKGFTLLEALFAVLIVAILAAIAVPMYANTRKQSADDSCMNNVRAIATAESKYKFENGVYTATIANLEAGYGLAKVPSCPWDASAYTTVITGAAVKVECASTDASHADNEITLN
jgi:prepilin-type N-terminal cleavage/methylation domain-containing protein